MLNIPKGIKLNVKEITIELDVPVENMGIVTFVQPYDLSTID